MKLSEVKQALNKVEQVRFTLPNGNVVPEHFHVTEIGLIDRFFIDCGGTKRKKSTINFQLYTADDYDHRLSGQKLNDIINLSEDALDLTDLEVEVEYQNDTVGVYGLDFDSGTFILTTTKTDCLAKVECALPESQDTSIDFEDKSVATCC